MSSIEQLKRYIIESKNLSEPLNYFFDLMDADVFSKIKSHRTIQSIDQNSELTAVLQVIQTTLNDRLGKSIKQLSPLFNEIPENHFFHGPCFSSELLIPLTILYFSDVKIGIFCISDNNNTEMFRFTLMKESEMKNRILN
jgi:hypothetical protein